MVARRLEDGLEPLHRRLAEFNRLRLVPSLEMVDWQLQLRREVELRIAEGHFIEAERAAVSRAAERVPTEPYALLEWFEKLRESQAERDRRFFGWVADSAGDGAVSWFLTQELSGEDCAEDLFALAQLRLPARPKLEIARCYWDEMGQGQALATSASMTAELTQHMQSDVTLPPVWERLARSNLMFALTMNRRYGYQALGALGVQELTSAEPARQLAVGLERLKYSLEASAYFAARARLAPLCSHAWAQDVILPLVARDSRAAKAIAEGALMRLQASGRCFARYARDLGVPS
jgi:Iron-containing redox enzyme